MAITPTSTVYLCNVALDSTYKHQYHALSRANQLYFFKQRVGKTFTEYLPVRTTKPDGGVYSSIKVNENIDKLYPFNYMFYQNADHGERWFYAFITKLIYINEETTEIVFETDVFQTWFFDCALHDSFVVREHSKTDELGDNIVPESFNFQDYTYEILKTDYTLLSWGYLVGSSEFVDPFGQMEKRWDDTEKLARSQSGIYQGTYFYFLNTDIQLNRFIKHSAEQAEDSILFITAIPEFNVEGSQKVDYETGDDNNSFGYVMGTTTPHSEDIDISFNVLDKRFGGDTGYKPVNNKLYTSPFMKIVVSNHNGESAEYNLEDFSHYGSYKFKMYGDISASPSITLVPQNYKGITSNYDAGISITNFPQCSFNSDTFKLWLAKNQFGLGMSAVTSVGEMIGGVAMMVTGVGAMAGAGLIAHGASSALNSINSVYQASREPNKVQGGGAKSNLLTAMGENRFSYYLQTIKPEHAKTIDNYFSMYGYQTNKTKKPNIRVRSRFTYTQTSGCNITGNIPQDDLNKLKSIFDNGVTIWVDLNEVGDYGLSAGKTNTTSVPNPI